MTVLEIFLILTSHWNIPMTRARIHPPVTTTKTPPTFFISKGLLGSVLTLWNDQHNSVSAWKISIFGSNGYIGIGKRNDRESEVTDVWIAKGPFNKPFNSFPFQILNNFKCPRLTEIFVDLKVYFNFHLQHMCLRRVFLSTISSSSVKFHQILVVVGLLRWEHLGKVNL